MVGRVHQGAVTPLSLVTGSQATGYSNRCGRGGERGGRESWKGPPRLTIVMAVAGCLCTVLSSECVRVSVCPACQFPPKLSLLLTLVGLFTPRLPDHQLACSVSAALTTPGITNNKTNSTLPLSSSHLRGSVDSSHFKFDITGT